MANVCSVEGCTRPVGRKGYCHAHYARKYKFGTVEADKPIRSDKEKFFHEAVNHRGPDCYIWPFAKRKKDGYSRIVFKGKMDYTHRHVCREVHGEPPSSIHEAAHSCGKFGCVSGSHLSWKTHPENEQDKFLHGTNTKPRSALDHWEEIRFKYSTGKYTYASLAHEYGIGASTVSRIVNEY